MHQHDPIDGCNNASTHWMPDADAHALFCSVLASRSKHVWHHHSTREFETIKACSEN
jgi:hypothetical protein